MAFVPQNFEVKTRRNRSQKSNSNQLGRRSQSPLAISSTAGFRFCGLALDTSTVAGFLSSDANPAPVDWKLALDPTAAASA